MLVRNASIYLLARGVPGVINLLALAIYTRLLDPSDYGRYIVVLAIVGLAALVGFQWLQLGILRFLPRFANRENALLSTVASVYAALILATLAIGLIVYVVMAPGPWRSILPVALFLVCSHAWCELNLQVASSKIELIRYGLMSGIRAGVALGVGIALIAIGYRSAAPLWGAVAGGLIAALVAGTANWRNVRPRYADPRTLRQLALYGLPLGATFIFAAGIASLDRLLLAWLVDNSAAGVYAAGYDLTQSSLGMIMMVVNLAAYPLTVRVLESEGVKAARRQLEQQGLLLLAVAAPTAVIFSLLAANIAQVFLGPEFHVGAASVIPCIAVSAFILGTKAYYYDLAFQLGERTASQLWIMLAASVANLVLNLAWIPEYGVVGAAWAIVTTQAFALVLSIWIGRRYFAIPLIPSGSAGVLVAAMLMGWTLYLTRGFSGQLKLAGALAIGGLVYGIGLYAFNVGGSRTAASSIFKKWRST